MPIYRYHCHDCGKTDEYLLPMGKSPEHCSMCNSDDLSRDISGEVPSMHTGGGDSSEAPSGLEVLALGPVLQIVDGKLVPVGYAKILG